MSSSSSEGDASSSAGGSRKRGRTHSDDPVDQAEQRLCYLIGRTRLPKPVHAWFDHEEECLYAERALSRIYVDARQVQSKAVQVLRGSCPDSKAGLRVFDTDVLPLLFELAGCRADRVRARFVAGNRGPRQANRERKKHYDKLRLGVGRLRAALFANMLSTEPPGQDQARSLDFSEEEDEEVDDEGDSSTADAVDSNCERDDQDEVGEEGSHGEMEEERPDEIVRGEGSPRRSLRREVKVLNVAAASASRTSFPARRGGGRPPGKRSKAKGSCCSCATELTAARATIANLKAQLASASSSRDAIGARGKFEGRVPGGSPKR